MKTKSLTTALRSLLPPRALVWSAHRHTEYFILGVFLCELFTYVLLSFLFDFQADFDVDHFVSDCRKRVQLEELREDLELYYKLLKTAMVELINKDYADFVNLSTNLVSVAGCTVLFRLNMVLQDFYFLYEMYMAFILAFYDLWHLKLGSLILALRHHSCGT